MDEKQKFLLTNYRKYLEKDEVLFAQWLVEVWDENNDCDYPKWLEEKLLFADINIHNDGPKKLAHKLCFKILNKHKDEIEFPNDL